MAPMIVVTTNEIPGYRIEAVMGEVMGLTVRSANIGQNFVASFRSIGGGEVTEYTKLVYESRQEVMNRMTTEAQRRGANAVIGMRSEERRVGKECRSGWSREREKEKRSTEKQYDDGCTEDEWYR